MVSLAARSHPSLAEIIKFAKGNQCDEMLERSIII